MWFPTVKVDLDVQRPCCFVNAESWPLRKLGPFVVLAETTPPVYDFEAGSERTRPFVVFA